MTFRKKAIPRLDLARGDHAGNLEGATERHSPSVDKWNAGLRDGASRAPPTVGARLPLECGSGSAVAFSESHL